MSKRMFEMMRAQEMATLYDSTFTKKEATATGKNLVKSLLDSGDIDKMELAANLARLNEVVSSAMNEIRDNIIDIEKTTCLGVEFNPVSGGNTINYSDDEIWTELKRCLDERTEQLKMARKKKVMTELIKKSNSRVFAL